ncbi:MAG: hypothetical protein E7E73_00195 [Negativicoccus succinicivorans]|nr:hypothetical protein [Negativicoccus succinicivorans]
MNWENFNEYQRQEIEAGQKSGVDVSLYADPKYDFPQMEAIRIGLEQGLDVSVYADPNFSGSQMVQIRWGLENGVDVSIYADPKFRSDQMWTIREGLEEGLDVKVYADPKFNYKQMDQIRWGLADNLPVDYYADPKFDEHQMYAIAEGLRSHVDVMIYADPKYDANQMCEIRWGLEEDLDVSAYLNPELDHEQMEEIRCRLEKDLEITAEQGQGVTMKIIDYNQPLIDDYTPTGGTAHSDERLWEFMMETGLSLDSDINEINKALKECGILPVKEIEVLPVDNIKNMDYADMQKHITKLFMENYSTFEKARISMEQDDVFDKYLEKNPGIKKDDLVNKVYQKYVKNDGMSEAINEYFDNMISASVKELQQEQKQTQHDRPAVQLNKPTGKGLER